MPRESPIVARLAAVLSTFILVAVFAACAPAAPEAQPEAGPNTAASPDPAHPSGTATAYDVSNLDICSQVPVAEVAAILGHDPARGTAEPTMRRYAADCTYSFDRGDGSSDYAMIWAYPARLWAPGEKGAIESVPDLGDAAFFTTVGNFAQMNVLIEGQLYLDTRADTPERARALAERAIAGLDPAGSGITSP